MARQPSAHRPGRRLIRFTTGQVGRDIGYGCSRDGRVYGGDWSIHQRPIRSKHKRTPQPRATTTTSKTRRGCTERRHVRRNYRAITTTVVG